MKTIFITGVSRGIGKAVAQRFLDAGDVVVGTLMSGAADWSHENLTMIQLDLSNPESISKCAETFRALDKKIDILINNAGVLFDRKLNRVDVEILRKTLEVNVIGTIDLTEHMLPFLGGGAHILNISSSAGSLARSKESDDDEYPAYRISKTALNMYTRALAVRLVGTVTVSSVHPGWVKTDMGGSDGDMEPKEAAEHIFKLAYTPVETGQFWFKGEKFPW
ncbi:MAG: hypothetical protein RLY47_605 [Candidatus Parcubacteria bacterium]|jgi:NAD(P)-dependent dehydrogenase (short-subunit alcohol dehydrogenase family)